MNNPFAILGIDKTATKKEILQQVAVTLRSRSPYDARTVAEAQKTLFSPVSRAEAEFADCLDLSFLAGEAPREPPEGEAPKLDLLDLFD
jgi:hypothetical protein